MQSGGPFRPAALVARYGSEFVRLFLLLRRLAGSGQRDQLGRSGGAVKDAQRSESRIGVSRGERYLDLTALARRQYFFDALGFEREWRQNLLIDDGNTYVGFLPVSILDRHLLGFAGVIDLGLITEVHRIRFDRDRAQRSRGRS